MQEPAGLRDLLGPVIESLACELWGIEYQPRATRSLLRIFIDAPNGVTLDDCEKVSRQISAVLDVEDPLSGEYVLEVSSPGLDRLLFTLDQCSRYVGAQLRVKLRASVPGRKNYAGQLLGIEDGELVIGVGEDEFLLPFEAVERVKLVPDDSVPSKQDRAE